jgi:SAGA-associated factor 29
VTTLKAGDMVAALVKGPEGDENWILAEVVSYNTSGKYEVDDIDEEQKDRHVLSKRRVMPLPLMRANPDTDPNCLFPKSSIGEEYIIHDVTFLLKFIFQ